MLHYQQLIGDQLQGLLREVSGQYQHVCAVYLYPSGDVWNLASLAPLGVVYRLGQDHDAGAAGGG